MTLIATRIATPAITAEPQAPTRAARLGALAVSGTALVLSTTAIAVVSVSHLLVLVG